MLGEVMEGLHLPHPKCMSSIWLFLSCILYTKLVSISISQSSVTCSSKSSNLRRGSWEPLIYSQLVKSTSGNLGLMTGV